MMLRTSLKKALLHSGCAVALIAGVTGSAQAQLSGLLNVGTTGITGGGGFGLNGKAWIPFLGVAGAYLEGGFQDHDPFVDVGFGSRFMLGNNLGIGGLLTFSTQRGHDSHDQFYSIKPTVEVGLGNLTLGATFNIPVGSKEHTVKNSGSAQGQLRNKPGTTTCTNPTNTDNKVCDLWLVGRENSVEQNRFGVDLNAQYELSLGGFSITPQVGLYVYDRQGKNLVGVHGGVDVGFNIGYGLTVDVSAGIRHDNKNHNYDSDHRTQGVFTGGLTWHFGGNLATASSRFVDRAPLRTVYDRGIRSHQQLGNSFEERARLQDSTSNTPVVDVLFVDSSIANPYNKFTNLTSNQLLIVQGGADIAFGNNGSTIGAGVGNVYVVGGGSNLGLVGMNGHTGTFHTPGSRPTITADAVAGAVFDVNASSNVIFKGLDIVGTGVNTTRAFRFTAGSNFGVVDDVSIANVRQAVDINMASDSTRLNNLRITNSGTSGGIIISVDASWNVKITNLSVRQLVSGSNGVVFQNDSRNGSLSGFTIDDDNHDYGLGVAVDASQHVKIEHGTISNFGTNGTGILVNDEASDFVDINDITINLHPMVMNNRGILIANGADEMTLTNVRILGNGSANSTGLTLGVNSTNIRVGNFHAENLTLGFDLANNTSSVFDLGGNSYSGTGTACDTNAMDVMGTGIIIPGQANPCK